MMFHCVAGRLETSDNTQANGPRRDGPYEVRRQTCRPGRCFPLVRLLSDSCYKNYNGLPASLQAVRECTWVLLAIVELSDAAAILREWHQEPRGRSGHIPWNAGRRVTGRSGK
jgi:hypothetical protein